VDLVELKLQVEVWGLIVLENIEVLSKLAKLVVIVVKVWSRHSKEKSLTFNIQILV
jgi:hypothetical protein